MNVKNGNDTALQMMRKPMTAWNARNRLGFEKVPNEKAIPNNTNGKQRNRAFQGIQAMQQLVKSSEIIPAAVVSATGVAERNPRRSTGVLTIEIAPGKPKSEAAANPVFKNCIL